MMLSPLLLLAWLGALPVTRQEVEPPVLPEEIEACLERPAIRGRVTVQTTINPLYLRGDFDGDHRPDYALAVRGVKSDKVRVLMCPAQGAPILLGREGEGPAFSDMDDDNFMSSIWMVVTPAQVRRDTTRFPVNMPPPIPNLRGEVVRLVWEDGTAFIYWDGKRFRWSGSKE